MTLSDPALTVAMSVYNNAAYVGAAIDSILAQSFTDFEFLIVNDGSSDGSGAIIEARAGADRRIRVIHQANLGFIASLNRMLAEARAPLIARMDGDDTCTPDRFARQLAFLAAHPDHGAVSCECTFIDAAGNILSPPPIDRPLSHAAIAARLETGPLLNHNAVIYDRGKVQGVGGYRAAYRHAEDYDLWLRLSQVTRLANLPEKLVDYRVYPEQASTRHLVEQTRNAAIAWLAHNERLAGRPDPTQGADTLPGPDELDAVFGPGAKAYVDRRVVERVLYSAPALAGDGWPHFIGHIRQRGADPRLWRATARLLRAGYPRQAGRAALALARG